MDKDIKSVQFVNQQWKELTSLYHYAASHYGITDGEFWVLYTILVLGGQYSQQDICDLWSFPKQTINSVISNLKKKGYVYLETLPGAGNKKLIQLTEEGKALGEKTVIYIYKAEQRALAKFSAEDLKTFTTLSERYIALLRKEFDIKEE